MTHPVRQALAWAGVHPHPALLGALATYREWLATEAVAAGGIGPDEADRIDARHIADSLLFAGVWDAVGRNPVLDVGSGVGLPGIPLALVAPERLVVLLDRSGRRVGLLRRITRILALDNVEVVHQDLADYDWSDHTVVSRASLSPTALQQAALVKGRPRELLVGGSHVRRPEVLGFDTVEIPAEILAWPVWILRMAQ